MKKQLIGFTFLFLICVLMPFVAMAGFKIESFSSGPPYTITPGGGTVGGGSFTFGVKVSEDGSPVSGHGVTFSVSPDDGIASLSTTSTTTDSNGKAQTTLSLLDASSESEYIVTAKLNNVEGSSGLSVLVTGSDGEGLTLSIHNPRVISYLGYGSNQSVGFTVSLLKDGTGVSGKTVTFSVSPNDGTASLSTTSTTTDSNGSASTILTLGSNASGQYSVTATLDNGTSKRKRISVYNPNTGTETPDNSQSTSGTTPVEASSSPPPTDPNSDPPEINPPPEQEQRAASTSSTSNTPAQQTTPGRSTGNTPGTPPSATTNTPADTTGTPTPDTPEQQASDLVVDALKVL